MPPDLCTFNQTCTHAPQPRHMPSVLCTCSPTCAHVPRLVHMAPTCSHAPRLVHMSPDLFTCPLTCAYAPRLVHIPPNLCTYPHTLKKSLFVKNHHVKKRIAISLQTILKKQFKLFEIVTRFICGAGPYNFDRIKVKFTPLDYKLVL